MPMEYFGRLGLVFRKNKERGTSPCQVAESRETRSPSPLALPTLLSRCAVEPWGDRSCNQRARDTDLKSVINESTSLTTSETGHTQGLVEFRSTSSPQVKGAAVLDMKNMPTLRASTTAQYFPRQDVFVDIEYLEYEQHVQARARALKNESFGSGWRFGWKALIFWKRQPRSAGMKSFISAASTPLHHQPFRTPLHRNAVTPGRKSHGTARRGCATVGPLYTNESPSSMQQFSHRAWKDDCNMSPYVALSDRRQRVVSPGPLYLV